MATAVMPVVATPLVLLLPAACGEPPAPPAGAVRIEVTADTTLSAYPGEQDANLGGAPWLKAKSYQEFFLVKPDTQPLAGQAILNATLHVKVRGDDPLRRVSVSTVPVPVPWAEGNGNSYDDLVNGAASFRHAAHPDQPWSDAGDATTALFGQGNSRWHFADATPPDEQGWQRITIDPEFLLACTDGRSHGLAIMDDVGSEWRRKPDGSLGYKQLPNRYLHSRQSGAGDAPYFTVTLQNAEAKQTNAAAPTPPATIDSSDTPQADTTRKGSSRASLTQARWIMLGTHRVALIHAIQRIDPYNTQENNMLGLPATPGHDALIHTLKNEHTALGLVIEGDAESLTTTLRAANPALRAHIQIKSFDAWPVKVGGAWQTDPLLPENHDAFDRIDPPRHHRVVTLFTGPETPAGVHDLALVVSDGRASHTFTIALDVADDALPDALSFVPQLNSYAQPQNPADTSWHRLAHEYRCVLNRLPYNWKGQPSPNHAPALNPDGSLALEPWLDRIAPLLDGSAFADLPRGRVPVEFFYLPISENWPVPFDPHYHAAGDDKYWIDRSTDPAYWQAFHTRARSMLEALERRGFDRTVFEFYLNNKIYYRRQGWNRTSAYWVFDEPVHTQDFWALRRYGLAFHQAVQGLDLRTAYRVDLSRPQLRRDLLDGVANTLYLAGNIEAHLPVMREKQARYHETVFRYGSLPGMDRPLADAVNWCVDAWRMGFDGVLPWQTIGRPWAWKRADPQAILYPGAPMGIDRPLPSLKLLALRRAQQDIERMLLAAQPPHQKATPVVERSRLFIRVPPHPDEHYTRMLEAASPPGVKP